MSGSGSAAVKREAPTVGQMRAMDRYTLQTVKTRAIEATQSIRQRIHRLEAGVYEPSDETTLSRTKAALLRWEAVPALIDSILAEDEAGPRDELRHLEHALYRSVGRMLSIEPGETWAYVAALTAGVADVRLHYDLITNHLNPEGTTPDDQDDHH